MINPSNTTFDSTQRRYGGSEAISSSHFEDVGKIVKNQIICILKLVTIGKIKWYIVIGYMTFIYAFKKKNFKQLIFK